MKMNYFILICLLLNVSFAIGQNSVSQKTDPKFFPIAVWLQNPENAEAYSKIGINMYVGLSKGFDQTKLDLLKKAKMKVICNQNAFALSHLDDNTIYGWAQRDEPDDAQSSKTGKGYDPCIDPAIIIKKYEDLKKKDSTRPVYLNVGVGAADTGWYGRGTCTGKIDMYKVSQNGYLKGCDIASFDIYPVNSGDKETKEALWYVAKGIDNLIEWTDHSKPVWCWIECTKIDDKNPRRPTTSEVKSEVWMALIHGAKGFGYFCHAFTSKLPSGTPTFPGKVEAAPLYDPEMSEALKSINNQITSLAPVLNSPNTREFASVNSSNPAVPVDIMAKNCGGADYLFAVAMRKGQTTATFNVKTGKKVEVLGEKRTLKIKDGKFSDDFSGYGVHLYKIK
jgi:type 1 fimbria pilin